MPLTKLFIDSFLPDEKLLQNFPLAMTKEEFLSLQPIHKTALSDTTNRENTKIYEKMKSLSLDGHRNVEKQFH